MPAVDARRMPRAANSTVEVDHFFEIDAALATARKQVPGLSPLYPTTAHDAIPGTRIEGLTHCSPPRDRLLTARANVPRVSGLAQRT
jgi:hypothetical protein